MTATTDAKLDAANALYAKITALTGSTTDIGRILVLSKAFHHVAAGVSGAPYSDNDAS
jgi:hypothetical protein